MTRLLLHIGHPKTGTTALQSVLSANTNLLLKEAATLYPVNTTPSEYKHALAIPFLLQADNGAIRRRARSGGDKLRETSGQYWRSLTSEVHNQKPDLLIISAEGFWSILRRAPEEQIKSFHSKLYEIADHVTICGYLKSPVPYILSRINQKLRNFRPATLPRPDYLSSAIKSWESLGFDAYSWRIFDRRLLRNKDIVDDFCHAYMPKSFDTAKLRREGVEQSNSSVSTEALVILEEIVEKYPILQQDAHDRRRHKIISILREAEQSFGGTGKPALKESVAAEILGQCSDLQWLLERGLSFPDVDPSWINAKATSEPPKNFTRVADFCTVDNERLASLRLATGSRIEELFKNKSQRFFWPFSQRPKN